MTTRDGYAGRCVPRDAVASVIEATVAKASGLGMFFDFDGTLAPIQDDPETVQLAPRVLGLLDSLSRVVDIVAVVSARNAAFLKRHFEEAGQVRIFGLYGLEQLGPSGEIEVLPDAEPWLPVISQLVERARRDLPSEVYVEDKMLSLVLHYRRAPHTRQAIESWSTHVAAGTGAKIQPGRMAIEIGPPLDRNKRTIIDSYLPQLESAWYFGDDVGDLPAFEALTDRVRRDPSFLAVKIAVANDDPVADLVDTADLVVGSPGELAELLENLLARLSHGRGSIRPTGCP
ncbi:MAG: trehalose-phosphatase [Pseudonocardiaceae bacterium]